MDITPEEFHRFAVKHHLTEVVRLAGSGTEVNDTRLRLAVSDSLSWAYRLHKDVRGGTKNAPNAPQWFEDFAKGAAWARHRIIHGQESILRFEMVTEIPPLGYDDLVAYNDPEIAYEGQLAHQSVVFAEVPQPVKTFFPGGEDHHEEDRHKYNAQIAGKRVAQVCNILEVDPAKL